jgi:hypothetical protein
MSSTHGSINSSKMGKKMIHHNISLH